MNQVEFFEQVDSVLAILQRNARSTRKYFNQRPHELSEAHMIRIVQHSHQEIRPLLVELAGYDAQVLKHAAHILRLREGVMGKRVDLVIGQSRANGVLGGVVSAFVIFTVANTIGVWLPNIPKIYLLTAAVAISALMVWTLVSFLFLGHEARRLNYYADLLDQVVEHQEQFRQGVAFQDLTEEQLEADTRSF